MRVIPTLCHVAVGAYQRLAASYQNEGVKSWGGRTQAMPSARDTRPMPRYLAVGQERPQMRVIPTLCHVAVGACQRLAASYQYEGAINKAARHQYEGVINWAASYEYEGMKNLIYVTALRPFVRFGHTHPRPSLYSSSCLCLIPREFACKVLDATFISFSCFFAMAFM